MPPQRTWLIGGGPECDLRVDKPTVSSRHCRLIQVGESWLVEDLGSSNGTFVDGVRVTASSAVTPAADVRLGQTVPMPWPRGVDVGGWSIRTIGREPDNDLVIDAPMISGYHARVLVGPGRAILEDLGSSNGTHLNAPDRPVTRAALGATDTIYLGSQAIPANRLLAAPPKARRPEGAAVAFRGLEMVLGRDPGCSLPLDSPMVSWHHARLFRSGSSVFVEDLGSSNGTFLNGRRVRRPAAVGAGDSVGLGSYTLTLGEGDSFRQRDLRGAITVEARGVCVQARDRVLLEGASLTLQPGELVGLMGPSGAGKSTLMRALNGLTRPDRGTVFYNGLPLHDNFDLFRGHIGDVPQDDIVHRELTVGQALRLTARLRLPGDFGSAEIARRVDALLDRLGLKDAADVPIGPPTGSGVSGGQRKRVNLAMELLTDPSVLFLDEPTSGLSSEDTLSVLRLLRELADSGKTILLTIHQPGLEAYRLLDRLTVVARDPGRDEPGRLVYHGPAYPDAIDFFRDDAPPSRADLGPSPDDLLRGLARRPASAWADRLEAMPHRVGEKDRRMDPSAGLIPPPRVAGGLGLRQWPALVLRNLLIKARDTMNTAILLAQAPIIAALVVLVFAKVTTAEVTGTNWPEASSGVASTMFVLGLAAIWFGCSNAVREVVGEWAVYRRERLVNLKLAPYIASKLAVLGGVCLFQCAVLLAVVYWGNGLKGRWPPMFGLLALASGVGLALGLTISAVARTSEAAIALLPLVILPMLILGGALQPLPKMHAVLRTTAGFLPSRWAFEGLLLTEADARPRARTQITGFEIVPGEAPPPADGGPRPEDMAERYFPSANDRMGVRASALALGCMLVGVVGGLAAILRSRDVY